MHFPKLALGHCASVTIKFTTQYILRGFPIGVLTTINKINMPFMVHVRTKVVNPKYMVKLANEVSANRMAGVSQFE